MKASRRFRHSHDQPFDPLIALVEPPPGHHPKCLQMPAVFSMERWGLVCCVRIRDLPVSVVNSCGLSLWNIWLVVVATHGRTAQGRLLKQFLALLSLRASGKRLLEDLRSTSQRCSKHDCWPGVLRWRSSWRGSLWCGLCKGLSLSLHVAAASLRHWKACAHRKTGMQAQPAGDRVRGKCCASVAGGGEDGGQGPIKRGSTPPRGRVGARDPVAKRLCQVETPPAVIRREAELMKAGTSRRLTM